MGKITGNVLVTKSDGGKTLMTAKAYIAMLEDRVIAAEAKVERARTLLDTGGAVSIEDMRAALAAPKEDA